MTEICVGFGSGNPRSISCLMKVLLLLASLILVLMRDTAVSPGMTSLVTGSLRIIDMVTPGLKKQMGNKYAGIYSN